MIDEDDDDGFESRRADRARLDHLGAIHAAEGKGREFAAERPGLDLMIFGAWNGEAWIVMAYPTGLGPSDPEGMVPIVSVAVPEGEPLPPDPGPVLVLAGDQHFEAEKPDVAVAFCRAYYKEQGAA